MAAPYTTAVLQIQPGEMEDDIQIDPPDGWVNSAWNEIIASTSTPIVLLGIAINPEYTGGGVGDEKLVRYEVDVAKGGVGAEVVVGTLRFSRGLAAAQIATPGHLYFPIPIDNVASGQRISTRIRANTVASFVPDVGVCLLYYEGTGLVGFQVTTVPCETYPSAADGTQVTSPSGGSAWASTAWVEMIASTPDVWTIGAIVIEQGGTSVFESLEVDLGIGGSGSESVIATMRAFDASNIAEQSPPSVFLLRPLISVPASSRLSWRMRRSSTSGTAAWGFAVLKYAGTL